jgi:stage III sporulation protein AA
VGADAWSYLPPPWQEWVALAAVQRPDLEEVRLRVDRPVALYAGQGNGWLGEGGWHDAIGAATPAVDGPALEAVLQALCQNSRYAHQEELRRGFLSLPGGHRVGVAAEAVFEGGSIRRLGHVSGLNLRLARAVGAGGEAVVNRLRAMGAFGRSLIIASPPKGGKTTLLRELVRRLANEGVKVAVLDERRELSGASHGRYHFDLGLHCDVLAGWPKARAGRMAIRTLSPQVMAMDELGDEREVALCLAAHAAGVAVMATVHAPDAAGLARHPLVAPLIRRRVLAASVVLSPVPRPGTVLAVAGPEAWA